MEEQKCKMPDLTIKEHNVSSPQKNTNSTGIRLFVYLYDILLWQEQYYAGLVFVIITTFCLCLYIIDLPVVTLLAMLCGIYFFVKLLVEVLPEISLEKRSTIHEEYEYACENLKECFQIILQSVETFQDYQQLNPGLFHLVMLGASLLVAWLGMKLPSIFFVYIIVLLLLALPGLIHNGKLQSVGNLDKC